MNPMVSVVVFNWNGKRYLKDCFDGLFKQTYKGFEVIFVDNGSTDGSVEFVKKNYPRVKIIANKSNLGIAEATNIGFNAAKGKYIASLHNDAIPDKKWLESFVKTIERYKNVAALEGEVSHFGSVGVINGSLTLIGTNALDVFDDPRKKFYSGTASMIIRNGILKQYCDPEFFFYGEDAYLGWQLRLMGWDIQRCPEAKVLHHGTVSATNEEIKSVFRFYSERNRMMNLLIFYERRILLKVLPLSLAVSLLYITRGSLTHLKALIWILTRFPKIMGKRRRIQRLRKVSDDRLTPLISSRVFPESLATGKALNGWVKAYCRCAGLKTVEA